MRFSPSFIPFAEPSVGKKKLPLSELFTYETTPFTDTQGNTINRIQPCHLLLDYPNQFLPELWELPNYARSLK